MIHVELEITTNFILSYVHLTIYFARKMLTKQPLICHLNINYKPISNTLFLKQVKIYIICILGLHTVLVVK